MTREEHTKPNPFTVLISGPAIYTRSIMTKPDLILGITNPGQNESMLCESGKIIHSRHITSARVYIEDLLNHNTQLRIERDLLKDIRDLFGDILVNSNRKT